MKSKTYDEFVEKFKPKKTTDDCYTPPGIYAVVRDWACREYGIDPAKIVRPFSAQCGCCRRSLPRQHFSFCADQVIMEQK